MICRICNGGCYAVLYNTDWYNEDLTTMMAIIGPTKAKIIPLSLGTSNYKKVMLIFVQFVRLVNAM